MSSCPISTNSAIITGAVAFFVISATTFTVGVLGIEKIGFFAEMKQYAAIPAIVGASLFVVVDIPLIITSVKIGKHHFCVSSVPPHTQNQPN